MKKRDDEEPLDGEVVSEFHGVRLLSRFTIVEVGSDGVKVSIEGPMVEVVGEEDEVEG